MAKTDPIAAAQAARDAADLQLAQARLPLVKRAQDLVAGLIGPLDELAQIRAQLGPGHAADVLGHLGSIAGNAATVLGSEETIHARTIARLSAPQA